MSTIGWSDLLLFAIFENEHIAADKIYFYELNSKKNRLACVMHTRQSFHLKKITGTLQKLIFFGKFANIFLLNNSGRNTVCMTSGHESLSYLSRIFLPGFIPVFMNPFRIYCESFCRGLYQCS